MNINIDNYKEVFSSLLQSCSQIESRGNKEVEDTVRNIAGKIDDMRNGGDELKKENETLKIGVVGQVKAGKSSFLNSLFFNGENVLPRASTPMTAGLTVLKYGDENKFEVEYYNKREWATFEDKAKEYDDIIECYRADNPSLSDSDIANMANIDATIKAAAELVKSCGRNARSKIADTSLKESREFSDISDLQEILETYVGANGSLTPIVKSLTISLNDERLRDIQIVDTPGVNDPVLSREIRTREFLRGCHGVFLLSYSGRFFDSTDVNFLSERIGSQGIGTVVLIASKFDSVLQDVGMKYQDDLNSALDYCQSALKKQYMTTIANSDLNGKDPILEFSSGIGFSIAMKDEQRRDEMEKHVVKRMKAFYPSFFDTPEDIRETFNELSQINEIREKHVEGTFKKNKDAIIQDKVNRYFSNANSNLKKAVTAATARLQDRANALKTSDIDSMETKNKVMLGVVKDVEMELNSIAASMDDVAEKNEKESINNFIFKPGSIPTHRVTKIFTRRSTFWGSTKSVPIEYDEVNLPKLIGNLAESWGKAVTTLEKDWSKRSDCITKQISDKINAIINDSMTADTEGLLDGKVMRNILNETIIKMKNNAVIKTYELKNKFQNELTSTLNGKDAIQYDSNNKMDENELKSIIADAAKKTRDNVMLLVNSAVSAQISGMETVIRKAAQDSINVLRERKGDFIASIEKDTKEYLSNLQSALQDKKENLQAMEAALNELNKITATL